MPRDYKDEYNKFQSSTKMKKKRAKLNKINRANDVYGNGDGKDLSHKKGRVVYEDEGTNRGRKEKSRLKGSKRKKYKKGGYLEGPSHKKGGITINVEGGEYIIKKDSVNDKTLPVLKKINKTGSYECGGHVWPTSDARKRKGGK